LAWRRPWRRCRWVSKPGGPKSRRAKPWSLMAPASGALALKLALEPALKLAPEPALTLVLPALVLVREPVGPAWEPLLVRARWWQESGPAVARSLGYVAAQHSSIAPAMRQSRRLKAQIEPIVSLHDRENQLTSSNR
jgi:hypothetical protein